MANSDDALKLFAISNQLIEHDLDRIEQEFAIDLGRGHQRSLEKDETYYPQIDRAIRQEASRMAQHYEVFYSLESSIRDLVSATLAAADRDDWWTKGRVPQKVKEEAESRMQRGIDTGYTPRSSNPIDFTTFGELGEIIKTNWDVFGAIFSSPKAVEKVMA